ncbi:MAG: 4Fe-4S dicluster domain-containing protein [Methanocorpusculum sp.]|nr:4Fe-4S dicluster domain-containing protein [Methanocorpusculum sp.]
MLPMLPEIVKQAFKKPATNLFPAKHLPKTITGFLAKVGSGEAKIHPPVESPANQRGKLIYDRAVCNGCGLCMKVCPAHAIEQVVYPAAEGEKPQKRIRIYVGNCIFCGQCIDICSKKALSQSSEYLLAAEDRFAETQIIE